MPIWNPKNKQNNMPRKHQREAPPDNPIDAFLSHLNGGKQVSEGSPYGALPPQSKSVPRPFIPPPKGAAPPALPGTEKVPEKALQGKDVRHVDRTNREEIIRHLTELECFNLIPLYEMLENSQDDTIVLQFEHLVKQASTNEASGDSDIVKNKTLSQTGVAIDDTDFGLISDGIGALGDEVFKTLVEKVFRHRETLPPIGVGAKPKAYYLGRLVSCRGVSPDINIYKTFIQELDRRLEDAPQSDSLEIEDSIISRDPGKYSVVRKIRERIIPAFTTYAKSNLGRKSEEIANKDIINLISNQYHCVEIRFDVSDFINNEAASHINVNNMPLARCIILMQSDPRTTGNKKKQTSPEINLKTLDISPKDTLGRSPMSFITSLGIETPTGEIINVGDHSLEYPKSESTCMVMTYKVNKKSEIFLVEDYELLYSLLRPLSVDEVVSYFN